MSEQPALKHTVIPTRARSYKKLLTQLRKGQYVDYAALVQETDDAKSEKVTARQILSRDTTMQFLLMMSWLSFAYACASLSLPIAAFSAGLMGVLWLWTVWDARQANRLRATATHSLQPVAYKATAFASEDEQTVQVAIERGMPKPGFQRSYETVKRLTLSGDTASQSEQFADLCAALEKLNQENKKQFQAILDKTKEQQLLQEQEDLAREEALALNQALASSLNEQVARR
jgi:hypothetical protein